MKKANKYESGVVTPASDVMNWIDQDHADRGGDVGNSLHDDRRKPQRVGPELGGPVPELQFRATSVVVWHGLLPSLPRR